MKKETKIKEEIIVLKKYPEQVSHIYKWNKAK